MGEQDSINSAYFPDSVLYLYKGVLVATSFTDGQYSSGQCIRNYIACNIGMCIL